MAELGSRRAEHLTWPVTSFQEKLWESGSKAYVPNLGHFLLLVFPILLSKGAEPTAVAPEILAHVESQPG